MGAGKSGIRGFSGGPCFDRQHLERPEERCEGPGQVRCRDGVEQRPDRRVQPHCPVRMGQQPTHIPRVPLPPGFSTGTENTGGDPRKVRGFVHGQEAVVPHLSRERAERERPGGLGYLIEDGRWPVGPAAETHGADEQARRGDSMPLQSSGLPADLAAIVRRGPRPGEPAGYGGVNPLAFAASMAGHLGWYNRCLAFVNAAWGYSVARFRRRPPASPRWPAHGPWAGSPQPVRPATGTPAHRSRCTVCR